MIRRPASVAVVLALAGCLAGCAAEPAPMPSATGFATEEEAFAAAEQTYRAYVDALNKVDLSDPRTFEGVYEWTTGDANAGERTSLSRMHADGWIVSGETIVSSVTPVRVDVDGGVSIGACTNVGGVTVIDSTGETQVSSGRPELQSESVTFVPNPDSPTGLLIADISGGSALC